MTRKPTDATAAEQLKREREDRIRRVAALERPVYTLVSLAYRSAHPDSKLSWHKLNWSVADMLDHVIRAEMEFEPDDIEHINSDCAGPYWMDPEAVLRLACLYANRSAVSSVLRFFGRERFLPVGSIDHTHYIDWAQGDDRHRKVTRPLDLLYVGACFQWQGERVHVTSFDDKDGTLTACSYHPHPVSSKVRKRYTISPADLLAERKRLKKATKAGEETP